MTEEPTAYPDRDVAMVKPITGKPVVDHVVLDRIRGDNVRTRCVISRSGAVSIGDMAEGSEVDVKGFMVVDLPRTELRRWLVAAIDMLDQ